MTLMCPVGSGRCVYRGCSGECGADVVELVMVEVISKEEVHWVECATREEE